MEYRNVDIERMSKETGLGIGRIKAVLGIPLSVQCNAETIEEAEAAYDAAETDSEEAIAAEKRWNELSMQVIDRATTPIEMEEVRASALYNSPARVVAEKKLAQLYLQRIEAASTPDELGDLYKLVPSDSPLELSLLHRWLGIVTILSDIDEVFSLTAEGSEVEIAALKKWHEVYMQQVATVTTREEAENLYDRAKDDIEEQAAAVKYAAFIITTEEASEAHGTADADSHKEIAIEKRWDELSLRDIEAATTFDEALAAYNATRELSGAYHSAREAPEVRAAAVKKLATFFQKV